MATIDDIVLLDQHNWFNTTFQTNGSGKVGVPKREVVLSGQASVALDRRNEIVVDLEIQEVSQENFSMLELAIEIRQFDAIEVKTADGIFTALKSGYSGVNISTEKDARLKLSPSVSEYAISDGKPHYWVLPLSNFVCDFLQRGEIVGQHPLRLDAESRVVEFLWQGMPSFIEPLLDYDQREKLLESSETQYLLTAVMVGEIGDNPTNTDAVETWFPSTLLRVLSFATGHEVAAPWIEFRDTAGNLVKRIHRNMGSPDFISGRRIIEEHLHPLGAVWAAAENKTALTVKPTQYHLSKLLEAVQSTPFCQTSTFFVLLHQALKAGASGQKLDDRLIHLFRAFDRLCKDGGFRQINLRDNLAAANQTAVLRILDNARTEIRVLASRSRDLGDTGSENILDIIAQKASSADRKDNNFGISMSLLLQSHGFHDEAVMNTHLAASPIGDVTTWVRLLNIYRNVAIHDGYFDTSDPMFSQKYLYSMNVHLQDLLARMLLTLCKYDGPYHPIPKIWAGSQDYINRIQPDTPAIELGYN